MHRHVQRAQFARALSFTSIDRAMCGSVVHVWYMKHSSVSFGTYAMRDLVDSLGGTSRVLPVVAGNQGRLDAFIAIALVFTRFGLPRMCFGCERARLVPS